MAEFCLECFNKLNKTSYRGKDVTLDDDFCEGCGTVKPCVVLLRPPGLFARIRRLIQNRSGNPRTIHHKRSEYKITRQGKLLAVERQMDVQAAYIRVFGAAGAALGALEPLRASSVPEIKEACRILQQAIEDTEEYTEIESP